MRYSFYDLGVMIYAFYVFSDKCGSYWETDDYWGSVVHLFSVVLANYIQLKSKACDILYQQIPRNFH